jgi:CHAT domain-containing protein
MTLLRAQKAATSLRTDTSHITLVAEKQAHEPNLQIIHEVDAEVINVAAVARSSLVKTVQRLPNPVTISETCAAMQAANIVHLACHGIQDSESAIESGFCLGDGRLTISKLMEMKLVNPFLAFLSACETAKGDENQPDQVMHLAAAMMFLGFKAVVATMWWVDYGMIEYKILTHSQGHRRRGRTKGSTVVLRRSFRARYPRW